MHNNNEDTGRDNYEKGFAATPNATNYDQINNDRKGCCSKMMLAKLCIGLGALLVIAGIVWGAVLPSVVNGKIDKVAVLSRPKDYEKPKYTDKYGDCVDCNPFYYSYHPFNITNANEFLNGAKLRVQELGPYVYRKQIIKSDVVFKGETVTFRSYNKWKFDPSKSCATCKPTDTTIGFELGYMGIMSAAGGEYNFLKTLLTAGGTTTESESSVDLKIKMGGPIILKLLYGYNSLSPEALKNLGYKAALALASKDLTTLMSLKMEGFDYNGLLVKRTVQQWAMGYPSILAGAVLGKKYKDECKGPGKMLERCANCVGDQCNAIGPMCNVCKKAQVVVQMNTKSCGYIRDIYAAVYGEAEAKTLTAMTCDTCSSTGLCAAQIPGAMEKTGFDWSQEQPPAVFMMQTTQKTGVNDKTAIGDYIMYENNTQYAIYSPVVNTNRNPTTSELAKFYGNCDQWTPSSTFTCIKIVGGEGTDFTPQGVNLNGIPSKMDQKTRQVFVSQAGQNVTLFNTKENVKYEDIQLVRFRPANDLLNPTPLNAKYGTGIPYRGLQPLAFLYGFLAYVSFPFFLYGQPDLLENVEMIMLDGTRATKESLYEKENQPKKAVYDRLSTFLDVEPASGKAMYAKKRMQGSVSLNRSPRDGAMPLCDILHPKIMPEIVFPIFWGEESGYITTSNANRVKSELIAVTKTFLPVFLVCLIVGLAVLGFGVFYFLRQRRAQNAAKGGMDA